MLRNEPLSCTPETNTLQIGRRIVAVPQGGVGGDRWEQQAQGEGPAARGRADRQRGREPAETPGVLAGSRHLDTASQVLFSVSADRQVARVQNQRQKSHCQETEKQLKSGMWCPTCELDKHRM